MTIRCDALSHVSDREKRNEDRRRRRAGRWSRAKGPGIREVEGRRKGEGR